jgi:hypothetical protein
MAKPLTTDELISSIKRRGFIPEDQRTYTTQDFLDLLNEEISMFGVPHLLSTNEEYLVKFEDEDLEQNVFEYSIPYRAIGNKLREASIIDGNDDSYEMHRISLDDLYDYRKGYIDNSGYIFYVQDNKIIFVNEIPVAQGKVRMYFYLQPNTLVELSDVGTITDINRTSGVITVNSLPTDFANLPLMDFVGHRSPNKIYSYDITPSSASSTTNTVTFTTTDIPTDLIVGDYICKHQESPVAQLPLELHPILAQRVVVTCLEGLGDIEGAQLAEAKLNKMESKILSIINNRVEGAQQKINNRNSPLSQSVSSGRRTTV